jgi:hypothetical protein
LWQKKTELDDLNIQVVVVTFESYQLSSLRHADPAMGFPYYHDQERRLYRYYGMYSAGFRDLWGPRTWYAYLRLLLSGRKMHKSSGDIHQRGGDVLINPQGVIRFHYIGSGPADRPAVENILQLVR